jgi:8-oxo-dGTP diphosphatase
LANKLGLKVEKTQVLEEGHDPTATYDFLRKAAKGPGDVVLCTHGDLVPELLRLAARDGLKLDDTPRWAKGSTWVLETDGKRFKRGRYIPPPES